MAIYLFSNPSDENDVIEVIMSVHDKHEYFNNGIKWNRIFTNPTASVSSISKIDPNSARQFADITGMKKGTVGDLQDLSKELSIKRESKEGKDVVKQKFYDNYAAQRKGKRHLNEKKEILKKELKNNSIFEIDI